MRAPSLLLVAALGVGSARADDASLLLAGVVPAPETNAAVSVSAMTVTSPISFSTPSATTPAPSTVSPPSPTTKTPTVTKTPLVPATTSAPTTDGSSATTATPTTTTTAATTPTPSASDAATGSGTGASSATVGAPVSCAFRFSMPAASNLADELARLAASQKKQSSTTTTNGGSGGSNSTSSGASDSSTTPTNSSTGTTTGSGAGETLPTAGSSDGPTLVPSPSSVAPATAPTTPTTAPVATTKAPTPSTKAPTTTTKAPTTTTKAPTPAPPTSGSNDGVAGRRLQTETGVASPTPTTKKPSTTVTTTAPTPSSAAPPSAGSTGGGASSTPTPTFSSSDSSGAGPASVTASPTPTSPSSSSSTTDASVITPATVVTGQFTCDAKFYGAWKQLGLSCDGVDLDPTAAAAQSQCLIYSGVQSAVVDLKMCVSLCRFPKCSNGTWDYTADDGFSSPVYQKLNFVDLAKYLGKSDLVTPAASSVLSSLSLKSDRQCTYESESSFKSCQCENLLVDGTSGSATKAPTPAALSPVVDKGLGDADHWGDGVPKTSIDKVSIASAAIGSSAAAVSVAAGAVMSVAGSVMTTGAGVAGGVSATASLGLAMVAVDICQFSVMVNQMNLDATPRLLQEMGKRMAPSTFSFLPFGKVDNATASNDTVVSRRLMDVTNTNQTLGMERYAALIGVKVDMLFYLTLAGVMMLCVAPFALWALFVAVASPFVKDFRSFAGKWFDKAVGVLMMVLILSEYVVGVTATFQICYLIKYDKPTDAGLFLAVFALIFFALGTIAYGYWVIQTHESELRDLGTKDHFEKPVHARYGPLYDEYKFEGRYFFAPKLLLALMCGVTTGFIGMPGIWQVIVLISLHIAFLLYMEVKRPYPTAFVQKTSSFVIIIKISALFLTLFLISSATSLQGDIPVDLREGVGFAIIGLQVLVLVCLMIRQVYIFYVTWKLKREDDEKRENESQRTQSFQPLGGDLSSLHNQNHSQQYHQNQQPNQYNQYSHAVPIMDGGSVSTPMQQHGNDSQTPDQFKMYGGDMRQPSSSKLRGLQPNPMQAQGQRMSRTHTRVVHNEEPQGMRRTHTRVVHDDPTPNNNYRRHGGNEITL